MITILLAITCGSLVAAVCSATVAWRMYIERQRRSAARVAMLASALAAHDGPEVSEAPHAVAVANLFEFQAARRLTGRPSIRAAAVAALVVVLAAYTISQTPDRLESVAAPEHAPLELMSMRHTRDSRAFTVTGLVRNPHSGGPLAHVDAVVLAFDHRGEFVASGKAALDFVTLEPGAESPFVVAMPGVANVNKYRVSFRTGTGLVRHVDRRVAERLARAQP